MTTDQQDAADAAGQNAMTSRPTNQPLPVEPNGGQPMAGQPMAGQPTAGQLIPQEHRRPAASPVRVARTAGLLYLAVAVLGGFAQIVRVMVYAPGDAAATTGNIAAHATLVRLSFVADLVQALVWLALAVTLHRLLAHAGRSLARAMVVFVVASAATTTLNMVHQLGALLVATDHSYATALGTEGSQALVLLLMDLQHYGYLIAQLGWLWLFTLGLLGHRSGMLPKWLCNLLMLATVCYVIDALTQFLFPSAAGASAATFVLPEIVCEVSLLIYLLVKGVRTPTQAVLAPVPA